MVIHINMDIRIGINTDIKIKRYITMGIHRVSNNG